MRFELFVAARFLWARRKGLFAWITTLIGIAGVAIGVAALITTLSVMNGFQSDIQKKIIGAQAHVVVYGSLDAPAIRKLEELLSRKGEVAAFAPVALGQTIVAYRGRSTGVLLRGLDPEREFRVNDLAHALRFGAWDELKLPAKTPGCVLGEELAKMLGVWIGEEVVLLSPQGAPTALGLIPKMRKFRVIGLLKTGYYEYDSATAYVDLKQAASFLGLRGGASGMALKLRSLDSVEPFARRLQGELGFGYTVRSFKQMNQTLFAALRLEKYVMFLILALIILVATFNIASNLILLGNEKVRDIGLLKALGATTGQIYGIFLCEGLLIGNIGVGLGTSLGIALSLFIRRYPLVELPADIYYLSRVPVHIDSTDVLMVAGCGAALTLLATLYPAWRASRVPPVEAIHYG